jgi:hypothetical protein
VNDSRTDLVAMESALKEHYSVPGFLLTEADAAFVHFETHDLDLESFENNRMATYVSEALIRLKNYRNLTKTQLKQCLKNKEISTINFCTPKVAQCDPSKMRYRLKYNLEQIIIRFIVAGTAIIRPTVSATIA